MSLSEKRSSFEEQDIQYIDKSSRANEDERKLEQGTNIINRLGLKFNAEIRGVERVPEEKRVDTSWTNPLTMFLSPNLAISALSTGMFGPTFYGLDFRTCVYCGVLIPIISSFPVGLYAIFGAKFGLRQQILSRYFTGNIMGRIFAFFNVISCIGWNAINVIPAVQMLVSLGNLPPWAGCIIFVVITCVMACFGYKVIHMYERWSWIPNFIVYLIMIARMAKAKKFVWEAPDGSTVVTAGNVFSYITTIFGFVAGWSPSAADYFVYMPSDTSPYKIFGSMVIGMSVPSIFTLVLGSAFAMGTLSDASWNQAFEEQSVGGIVNKILVEDSLHGFGKFCVVILALSAVANNLPGSYSLALAAQAMWSKLAGFPRLGWCVIGNFVSLGLSIPAYYVFEATMTNFLSIIGYNVSIYIGISLAEHLIYRRGFKGYDVSNFNDPKTLPVGIAGVVGFLFGLAATVLSMNQTWYVGVIARKISGDISFELNVMFSFIGYNLARPLELRYFGR